MDWPPLAEPIRVYKPYILEYNSTWECKSVVRFNLRAKAVPNFSPPNMSPPPWTTTAQHEVLEQNLPEYTACCKKGRATIHNNPKEMLFNRVNETFDKKDPGFLARMVFKRIGLGGTPEERMKAFRAVCRIC